MRRYRNNLKQSSYKEFIQNNYLIIIFSVIYFLMLLVLLNHNFFSDEIDNFLGASMVIRGRDIYSHHISQHMPFSYYIFAIPVWLFNIKTIVGFKLSFFCILIIIWILMYFRYKNYFGKITMLIYPILYIFSMAFFSLPWNNYYLHIGASAISDQFQGQGLVILLLEFLMFIETKNITWKNAFFISMGLVLSFGTTFVSVFPIIFLVVGFIFITIQDFLKRKSTILFWFKKKIINNWREIIIILLPFAMLTVWYIFTNNLYNFYFGAYVINAEIYSKYQEGFGSSAFGAIFNSLKAYYNFTIINITLFLSGTYNIIKQLIISFDISKSEIIDKLVNLRQVFFIIINILFFITFSKKYKWLTIIIIFFTIMTGVRSFYSFHSFSYLAVTFIMSSILINRFYIENWNSKVVLKSIILIIFIFIMGFHYAIHLKYFINNNPNIFTEPKIEKNTYEYIIKELIPEDESIYISTLDTHLFISTQRFPIYSPSTPVPWMWQGYKENDYIFLNEYKPKVLYHNDEYEVWGNKLKDYAPDFIDYVHNNYSIISEKYPYLYVRNEYLEKAKEIFENIDV